MLFSRFSSPSRPSLGGTLAAWLGAMVFSPLPCLALDDLKLPQDVGLPSRRQAGGTRDVCLQDKTRRVISLVPQSNSGRTLSASPTVFVYLPQYETTTPEGLIIVQELDQEKLAAAGLTLADLENSNKDQFFKKEAQSRVTLTKNSGVLGLPWGEYPELPQLEPGKIYLWAFQLVCNGDPTLFAEGWIQRVASVGDQQKIQRELDLAKSYRDRAKIYAQSGLWYDLLSTLAAQSNLASAEREQGKKDWQSVLLHPQVNLPMIVDEPLLPFISIARRNS